MCSQSYKSGYPISSSPVSICTEIETLLKAFVLSKLDYCNSPLYGRITYKKKLQKVQSLAARIIFKCCKYNHLSFYTPLLATYKGLHRQLSVILHYFLGLTNDSSHLLSPRKRCLSSSDNICSLCVKEIIWTPFTVLQQPLRFTQLITC